jgi:phage shock protein A
MPNLPAVQVPLPLKGFEKTARVGITLAIASLGLVAGQYLLPILIEVLKNGVIAAGWFIALGAIGVGLAAVIPIIGYAWPYVKHWQRVIALSIAESMVKKDPPRWLKIYIENHRSKLGTLANGIKLALAALTRCKDILLEYIGLRDDYRQKAKAAHGKGEKSVATRYLRQADRKDKAIKRLERRIQILEFIVRAMKKMHSALENTIADEEDELNSYIEEFETSKQVEAGIRAGMSALAPDEDQRRIKEAAMSEMLDKIYTTHAELEMALDVFQPIITINDLEDDAALARLEAEFDKWEQGADNALLGPGGKQLLLAETLDPANVLKIEDGEGVVRQVKAPVRANSTFDSLIDRK